MAGKKPGRAARSSTGGKRSGRPTSGSAPAGLVTPAGVDHKRIPIVGIGASAGGHEAFKRLLYALPADTGMAFVLVQHLAPSRPSVLAELMSRATKMPVVEVQDGSAAEPNHVYVIPPGQNMIISGGVLKLFPRKESGGAPGSIDIFFRSLAEDVAEAAIGVVLSGSASDGTVGLEEIKAAGGITFAQDESAQHPSMPHSAIAAGCVDCVLPPELIGQEIAVIGRQLSALPVSDIAAKQAPRDGSFERILQILRDATGADFSQYKAMTIYRRILRRVVRCKTRDFAGYAQLLEKSHSEVQSLYDDILISVTSFFRDPEVFEAIKSQLLPKMCEKRSANEPLRVWVLGCSTGQEAYSVAMVYEEFAAKRHGCPPLQILATDLSERALETARAATYARNALNDISPERLRRFFVDVDSNYRVHGSLREKCIFARHNVLADPPFSRLDLVTCRNVLIYLEQPLQDKLLSLFHYALKPGGFLCLGASETIGTRHDLFQVHDAVHKIYVRKPGPARWKVEWPTALYRRTPHDFGGVAVPIRHGTSVAEAGAAADRVLLARFAPAGVLVNADLEILQFRGDTGAFLKPSPGKATLNLLKMAREGLLSDLRDATSKARKRHTAVRKLGLQVKSNRGYRDVNLDVIPVPDAEDAEGFLLVLFEDASAHAAQSSRRTKKAARPQVSAARKDVARKDVARKDAASRQTARLRNELNASRDYLQSVIEQHEAANEELQSANEEIQSTNEELQSINEELETSKEEIQSTNEELTTVNDELRCRNLELDRVNSDLVNLLNSAESAIVMLGKDLRIRRFTPSAGKLLNLTPADIGRMIRGINLDFTATDVERRVAEVIDTGIVEDVEVRDRQGRWFSLRIRPYTTLDNVIDGAVITLVDMDAIKRALELAEGIVNTTHEPLLLLDANLRVLVANRAFYDSFHVAPEETRNRFLYDLGSGEWNIPQLRSLLMEIVPRKTAVEGFEIRSEFSPIGPRTVLLNARQLLQPGVDNPLILLAIDDVTVRARLEQSLRDRVTELADADRKKNQFLAVLAHELRNPLAALKSGAEILRTPDAPHNVRERAQNLVDREVQSMAHIVDDLLDVHRITRGTIELRKEPLDLEATLVHSVDLCRLVASTRGQVLEVSLPGAQLSIEGDRTRLEQVFGNLLDNASKFSGAGARIDVSVELLARTRGPHNVVVRIRDQGIGIAPEMLPRLFELFVQADEMVERRRGGLGIGLALARSLVELHGGTLIARSEGLDKGSEFVVELPIMQRSQIVKRQNMPATATRGDLPSARVEITRRRILVVDDNALAADSMADLLRLAGHQVMVAYDGRTALEAAGAFQPEVVLLDVGMPGMSGYDVANQLRASELAGASLRLVALTGYGDAESRQKSQQAGFNAHLVKPVGQPELHELLGRLFDETS